MKPVPVTTCATIRAGSPPTLDDMYVNTNAPNKINVTVRIPIKLCEFALSEPKMYPISNRINKLMRKSISYSNFLLIAL